MTKSTGKWSLLNLSFGQDLARNYNGCNYSLALFQDSLKPLVMNALIEQLSERCPCEIGKRIIRQTGQKGIDL